MKIERRSSAPAKLPVEQAAAPAPITSKVADLVAHAPITPSEGESQGNPRASAQPGVGRVETPVKTAALTPKPKSPRKPIPAKLIVYAVASLGLSAAIAIGGFQVKSYLEAEQAKEQAAAIAAKKAADEKARADEELRLAQEAKIKAEQEELARVAEEKRIAEEREKAAIEAKKAKEIELANKRSATKNSSVSTVRPAQQASKPQQQQPQPAARVAQQPSQKVGGLEITPPSRPTRIQNPPASDADSQAAKDAAAKKINEIRRSMGLPPI